MKRHQDFLIYQLYQTNSGSFKRNQQLWLKRYVHLGLLMLPLVFVAACGGNSGALWGPGSTQGNNSTAHIWEQGGLIIQAAPSLQFVLPSLVDAFLRSRHLNIPYVFDFTGIKQAQNTVNTGADTDLLIADDRQTMLDSRFYGITTSNGTLIATDSLSVILPAANPGRIATMQDLAISGHRYIAISNKDGLSGHIQATLEEMNLDPTFGIHYAARVYGNMYVVYTDGIAATRAIAHSPPAEDFVIAYHSTYVQVQKELGGKALTEIPIPSQFNPPVQILAAIASQSHNPALSQQLIDFLHSAAASHIWTQFGFTPTS
jgi:ABC-type molybdate transport system substrate-binding protein